VGGRRYLAHRLAWLYATGDWPVGEIDHINQDRRDNRLANLRPVERIHNSWNRGIQRNNKSGHLGVFWCSQKSKWQATIMERRKTRHLGYFSDAAEAGDAYLLAKATRDSKIPQVEASHDNG